MSSIYLSRIKEIFSSAIDRVWRRNLMRSGMVTGLILGLLVAGLLFAYRERGRGHLHRLESKIVAPPREDMPVPRPGGQEAIVLTRTRVSGSSVPEFLSAAMLPGRGMNVLQIRAYIPKRGEVDLLASPTVDEAAAVLTGQADDRNGRASLGLGGAIEAPWAGAVWGQAVQNDGAVLSTWRGHSMTLPSTSADDTTPSAMGGGLLTKASGSVETAGMPDGGQAQVNFSARDFGVHWPSKTTVTVTVLLSSRTVDLTVVAKNDGDIAEPIGIGWHPRFAILDGPREQIKMRIPALMRFGVRERPSGALVRVAGTPYDFGMRGGARLGSLDLNDCFVQLQQELLDSGPVAELNDAANDYGLRLTALSSNIKAMRVYAPANAKFVSIDPQFNYDDPFGREWGRETDAGMVILQPGESTQWKVRLELVSLSGSRGGL